MDNTTETPDIAALLAELDRLRHDVTAVVSPDNGGCGEEMRLVARVVSGLDEAQYARLLDATRESGWFALPLASHEYPTLHGLWRLMDALPGDVCQLTHALRPHAFMHRLCDEANRAVRHRAELALVLLASAGQTDDQTLLALSEAARLEMGGGETLARIDAEHLAVIVPSGRQLKVRSLAERILDHFAAALPLGPASPPVCPAARAGIACFSPDDHMTDALKIADMLHEQALAALKTAPPNQARMHQRDTRPMAERSVLVQAGEKQFLFFGSMEQS